MRKSYYSMPERPGALLDHLPMVEDSLVCASATAWQYSADGRMILEQHYHGKPLALNLEDRLDYGADGEVVARHHRFYKIPGGYYDMEPDSVRYTRHGDSVYYTRYNKDSTTNRGHFYRRTATAPRHYEFDERAADGSWFSRNTATYDRAGRLVTETNQSNRPAVQADGTVLRADSVVHRYDRSGRPLATEYYTEGIKRWQHDYSYIR